MDTLLKVEISSISEKDFKEKYTDVVLTKEERAHLAAEIVADIASIAKAEGFSSVLIYAHTPYFNDGEPCVHHQEKPFLDGLNSYLDRDYNDDRGEDGETASGPAYGSEAGKKEQERRKDATSLIGRTESRLESALGTNWKLDIEINGDSASFTVEENDSDN